MNEVNVSTTFSSDGAIMVSDFVVTGCFTRLVFFPDIFAGIKNNDNKERFLGPFLYHGELLQPVMVFVHFLSKTLNK